MTLPNSAIPYSRRLRFMKYAQALPGLLAYWPMGESQGSLARNYAPSQKGFNDLTVSGATLATPGKLGRAANFDAVNDYMTKTSPTSVLDFDKTAKYTWFGMVRPTLFTTSHLNTIIGKQVASTKGYTIGYQVFSNSADVRFLWIERKGHTSWGSTALSIVGSPWWFWFWLYDGAGPTFSLYINGVSRRDGTWNGTNGNITSEAGTDILIDQNGGTEMLGGDMQHLGIVSGLLTVNQINRLSHLAGFI